MNEIYGYNSEKRENIKYLNENEIIYSVGMCYMILNMESGEIRRYESRDGGGVGSIAVDKYGKYIAIGEKGEWPNIYVYDYPDLKLYRVLKKGTEKSYSHITFSNDG